MFDKIEEIEKLDEWKKKIYKHLSIVDRTHFYQIKHLFDKSYKTLELQTIKNQILLCISFGLNIAAMTLTNHLKVELKELGTT